MNRHNEASGLPYPSFFFGGLRNARIRTKLLLVLIPAVVAVLFVTGLVTSFFSQKFLRTALERSGMIQTMAMAHEMEDLLTSAKDILLYYSDLDPDQERMARYLAKMAKLKNQELCEFAYISLESEDHIYLIRDEESIHRVPNARIESIRPNPFLLIESARQLKPGEVLLKPFFLLDFNLGSPGAAHYSLAEEAVRLITPRLNGEGKTAGFYIMSFLAKDLRNILSLYNSEKSPVSGFPRSPEDRYGYLFDPDGWIHFQSEDTADPDSLMSTYTARAGYSGTLGFRGLEAAFRPEATYVAYWSMVEAVKRDQAGIIDQAETRMQEPGYAKAFYMPYAPVRFQALDGAPSQVVAGVAFVDKSRLTLKAGYKHIDVLFLIILSTIVVISLLIYMLSKALTRPIYELKRSVHELQQKGSLEIIHCPDRDYETTFLKNALNDLIRTLHRQIEELSAKDKKIVLAAMRERAALPGTDARDGGQPAFAGIIGGGAVMQRLFGDIRKAAQVEADVLITGETGTGKQMVAEAIHRLSSRSSLPFISINCGALDENLLLDTLFGHVRGAFTEAKTDRKGAFLAADKGILFLDEIQNATAKVQQALLRTISMRRFRPLGSDAEIETDVRLIAATNVDLRERIEQGAFREDLYFRLKVISIATPPLREHKENIPALAGHFLAKAETRTGKKDLGLTRGALMLLLDYCWPGNVRELENALLRAAVMAEAALIHASDIMLDAGEAAADLPGTGAFDVEAAGAAAKRGEWPEQQEAEAPDRTEGPKNGARIPGRTAQPNAEGLSPRQRAVLPHIRERDSISRNDYQILAGNIPTRTALHDLSDLVQRGFLRKQGSGPSTRYVPVPPGRPG